MVSGHVHGDLVRYVERQLDAAARSRVEAHLASCAGCRAEAAETLALVDELQSMPAALRGLPQRTSRDWAGVWLRVQRPAVPARPPRLSFCLSLVAVAFSLVTLLPVGTAGTPAAVTVGVVQTPRLAALTPRADAPGGEGQLASPAAATAAGDMALTAGPVPIPTPMPGSDS
jgi:anti-sigma factor RsiW